MGRTQDSFEARPAHCFGVNMKLSPDSDTIRVFINSLPNRSSHLLIVRYWNYDDPCVNSFTHCAVVVVHMTEIDQSNEI